MNIEKKPIILFTEAGKETLGYIHLDKVAIPETVHVSLFGKNLRPCSFDCYGQPIFPGELVLMCNYMNDELKRITGSNLSLLADVAYEERPLIEDCSSFNSVDGIEKSLESLETLNKMLINRRVYYQMEDSKELQEFIILGSFALDMYGQVRPLSIKDKKILGSSSKVEPLENLRKINPDVSYSTKPYAIPKAGTYCPCCGEMFIVDDIRNNPIIEVVGKYYHDSCYATYQRMMEINMFSVIMFSYKAEDYSLEFIPNEYENESSKTWAIAHTIDGDIKMGRKGPEIFIEWCENYKRFNFEDVFKEESIVKFNRGVYAQSMDDAKRYVDRVLKIVNPEYSRLDW